MLASPAVKPPARYDPWLAKPGRRQVLTAALACLFLMAATLSGVIGGARAGAEAWSIDGVVPPLCASLGSHAAPGAPATDHGDHGICALCSATGCVAGLAAPPAAAPLPQTVATVVFADRPWRELSRQRPVNWDARPRAPPDAA